MVKILASGEIVPDNDPRAKASAPVQRRPTGQNEPSRVPGATGSSSSSRATASGSSASPSSMGSVPEEENVIIGDLARALGVHGKSQEIMGRSVPLIYLIVGGVLAALWVSGNMNAIRMLVMGFVLYVMYTSYMKAQSQGASLNPFSGGFGGPGGSGPAPDDNSSRGHVINRGPPK
eukprot:TRINITY_DN113162_c0_g1_i1.p1 TRINITY_DN113162_c0_g1~~TRINITY_DN113162_c0_g1_i1.p1  ORF type:complete len:176 (-),score=27.87 TRINITY_DN113162_c0_g1_i1:49-576(-)